jgi:hypothetical protein
MVSSEYTSSGVLPGAMRWLFMALGANMSSAVKNM